MTSGASWEQPPDGLIRRPEPTPEAEPDPDMPTIIDASGIGPGAGVPPDPARACLQCGGRVDADGYCEVCGSKAPSERDHFTENPAPWVGGACDRGVRHTRNEDALALAADAEPRSRAVVVVCDGVSSSKDSDVASLAGARAARDLLAAERPAGMGVPESRAAAVSALLTRAVAAANDAVVQHTDPASTNAASCTFVGAVVEGEQAFVASIGDSRAYWVGDDGSAAVLTTDDSLAQEDIAAGIPRAEAESGPNSHTITRWLGRDAGDIVPETTVFRFPGDGWLLACSDGLWNYASDPIGMERVVAGCRAGLEVVAPVPLAEALVAWANGQGGADNVTVALVRVGAAAAPGEARPAVGLDGDVPTSRVRRADPAREASRDGASADAPGGFVEARERPPADAPGGRPTEPAPRSDDQMQG